MRKVISHPFTFFFKFVLPGGWVAAGLYTLAQEPQGAVGLFSCLWVCVSLLLFRRDMFPLKKVSLGEGSLRVSNYWREVEVPLSEVESVEAVGFGLIRWALPSIIVRLKTPSEFGEKLRFIPPGWYCEEVVAELRRATERSKVSLTGGRA